MGRAWEESTKINARFNQSPVFYCFGYRFVTLRNHSGWFSTLRNGGILQSLRLVRRLEALSPKPCNPHLLSSGVLRACYEGVATALLRCCERVDPWYNRCTTVVHPLYTTGVFGSSAVSPSSRRVVLTVLALGYPGGLCSIERRAFLIRGHLRNSRIGSETPVQSCAEHRDRAPRAVVSRVADELVVQRPMHGLPDLKIVIGFHNLFPAIVQVPVPAEDARAAGGEKLLMHVRDAVEDSRQAERVVCAPPELTFDAQTQ